MKVEDKAIRLKHIGLALNSFITEILAPIQEQVSSNTEKISDLENRVASLEAAVFGEVSMVADDSTETVLINGVSANDASETIIGNLVANDSTETITEE